MIRGCQSNLIFLVTDFVLDNTPTDRNLIANGKKYQF